MTTDVHPPRPEPDPPHVGASGGAPRRGPLRRYLETRGVVGGHRSPHVHTRLVAADGTELAGTHLPGPAAAPGAVLLLHGFAANRRKPAYARLADGLARSCGVLALDLRGHGGSSGQCTLGDAEVADVAAGVRWLRAYGYRRVALLGASMGGTAALHAVATGVAVDAVATVSAPGWFHDPPRTAPLRRLHALWQSPLQRAGLRTLVGVHLAAPERWRGPAHPVEMVRDVAVPLLVVHGEDDDYFPVEDAAALVAGAAGPATLWRRPAGFGHAEDGLTPAMVDALAVALHAVLADGAFPPAPPA
ncbi:alpha/beta hydrolase [Egicoccus halophilus]|uniref:Alpha/beta hydrolase n=1 Tax=Egicoccus halophilus TaxID=1670830 RepID=A0A8J3AGA0_9ACTN|nr:alpha/beta fold hydrolase [Egicoccus halophilus]GGI07598.1 alpha/beta hydrolase [Egicoccus halophilus]